MEQIKRKNLIEKIIILSLTAIVLGILVFFIKDIFVPFVKLQINKDVEGASKLIIDKGILGWVAVAIIEALQMVVIFIPAEFIQLTSGMTYPWYMAILLCDVGVIFGASIIYFIVRVFKFNGDMFKKQNKKIEEYAAKARTRHNSIVVFMLLLFIMPVIPFGAICYFGSSKKVPYHKYILTCAFGVIPSIGTSILMGTAIKEFIANALPLWILILCIIGAGAILFSLLIIVLHHFFFKENDGTPDSLAYRLIRKAFEFMFRRKLKVKVIEKESIANAGKNFILLANHHSAYDAILVYDVNRDLNYTFIVNRYYFTKKIMRGSLKSIGAIPKKMFDPDTQTIKQILKSKDKYPIIMYPAGRLSNDGTSEPVNEATAKLVKMLNVPVVLVREDGTYFARPKWRPRKFKSTVTLTVEKVYTTEMLKQIDVKELHKEINEKLYVNAFDNKDVVYKNRNKARGLDNLLYYCPSCKSLYSNVAKNNTMTCSCCGKTYNIQENYWFDDKEIRNIHEYYQKIQQFERENLDNINLSIPVKTKITNKDGKVRRDVGIFTLTSSKVSYKSNKNDLYFEYTIEELEGIAYSVNVEFEMYYKNELYYFYPIENRKICTRVALVYQLLRERING